MTRTRVRTPARRRYDVGVWIGRVVVAVVFSGALGIVAGLVVGAAAVIAGAEANTALRWTAVAVLGGFTWKLAVGWEPVHVAEIAAGWAAGTAVCWTVAEALVWAIR